MCHISFIQKVVVKKFTLFQLFLNFSQNYLGDVVKDYGKRFGGVLRYRLYSGSSLNLRKNISVITCQFLGVKRNPLELFDFETNYHNGIMDKCNKCKKKWSGLIIKLVEKL